MLNMNNKPNIMASIPIIMFNAENLVSIDAIPKNTKLIPIMIDTTPELNKGHIIKINPKIIDNIPDTLLDSIFFPPKFVTLTFLSETCENKKQQLFTYKYLLILFNICY